MAKKTSLARRKKSDAKSDRADRAQRPVTRPSKPRLREEFRDYARSAILEAGEEVLASQGMHQARMEEVAQKARVAVGTIYNLVGDREALVVEILRVRHQELLKLLAATLEELRALPFREQVQGSVVALFGYFREHWRFFRLISESERGPACPHKRVSQEILAEIRKLFRELIARGIKQRALRSEGHELYPAMLLGMIREVIIQDLEMQHMSPPQERAAQVLDLFLNGVGVP